MTTETPTNGGPGIAAEPGGNGSNNCVSFQQPPADTNGQGQHANPTTPNAPSNEDNNGAARTDICRDYLNNVCFRGVRCRFYHPPEATANRDQGKEIIKDFCHDYQNKGCTRESCRYIHCTRDDMEEYNRSGKVTEALAKALVAVTGQEVVDGRPLCKEYLSGKCSRGSRCRFWHINARVERERRNMERVSGGGYGARGGGGVRSGHGTGQDVAYGCGTLGGGYGYEATSFDYGSHQPEYKRPRLDDDPSAPAYPAAAQAPTQTAYMALQEENIALRRKIDILKQTVAELSAANDTMVAENNRLRAGLQVPAVGGPSVNDATIVGNMAAATALSGVLSSVSQSLAGQTAPQSAGMPALAADHLAVSLAAAAQQTMAAAAQQSMAMSATSDNVHWSVMRR